MSNLLVAIKNLITNPITDIRTFYVSSNRANAVWDNLEHYVKDLFCNSFRSSDAERNQKYSEVFSYLWNQNNPPDIILKNSDAIEVKKIEKMGSAIALNSSYPKNKLYSTDSRITEACRNCENIPRTEKDILYVIGAVPNNVLKSLWFIYGDCYAANPSIYQRIADRISEGVSELQDIELVETNELAKIKRVDPFRSPNNPAQLLEAKLISYVR